jgi:hypothetical protein
MSRLLHILITLISISGVVHANTFVDLADEITLPVPQGWTVSSDDEYPFQLVNEDSTAELLVFKSMIAEDERVSNDKELELSVDKVIEDVILTLPEAQLLTNTGLFEKNRVSFAVEFLSTDTAQDLRLRHRLKGLLYTHPDGYQILFSLWGKAAISAPDEVLGNIRTMQEGFVFSGVAQGKVFSKTARSDWVWIAIVLMLMAILMLLLKRRSRVGEKPASDPKRFWKCECGQLNHNDHQTCRRCDRPANESITL